jgi:hypothetical protein
MARDDYAALVIDSIARASRRDEKRLLRILLAVVFTLVTLGPLAVAGGAAATATAESLGAIAKHVVSPSHGRWDTGSTSPVDDQFGNEADLERIEWLVSRFSASCTGYSVTLTWPSGTTGAEYTTWNGSDGSGNQIANGKVNITSDGPGSETIDLSPANPPSVSATDTFTGRKVIAKLPAANCT